MSSSVRHTEPSNVGQAVPAAGYSPVVLSMSPRTVLAASPFRFQRNFTFLIDNRPAAWWNAATADSVSAAKGCHRSLLTAGSVLVGLATHSLVWGGAPS